MGKLAKVFLLLLLAVAIVFPSVALRVRGIIDDRDSEISSLEGTLEATREELEGTRSDLQRTRDDLERTRSDLQRTRSELERTRRDLDSARARVQSLETELSAEKSRRERAEAELNSVRRELTAARDDIRRKDGTIRTLQQEKASLEQKAEEQAGEIDRLRRIAGVREVDLAAAAISEGMVLESGAGELAAVFEGNMGIPPLSNLFVTRRGRVAERVQLKQLHGTNVVFYFSPGEIEEVKKGDRILVEEGGSIFIPELFRGRVPRNARQGFFTVEVDEVSFPEVMPMVSVYRDREQIAEARPGGIRAVWTVVEIIPRLDARILRSDIVEAGR